MSEHIVIVEQLNDWKANFPETRIVTAKDYLTTQEYAKNKNLKIINLCRSYRYLSIGYYSSLLAEARKNSILPSVRTITDLSSKAIYSLNIEDLDDQALDETIDESHEEDHTNDFVMRIFFGQCDIPKLQDIARQIYDLFRCPLLKVEFKHKDKWYISSIKPMFLQNLADGEHEFFIGEFSKYLSKKWRVPKTKNVTRYDIAILHNPTEKLRPSNKKALEKFKKIGKSLDISVDFIEKRDYARVAEYDALFIRETTQIEHYTYRFAKKAESEGMVVIDDPESILKCTNKVYLAELLRANKVPTPKTIILHKQNTKLDEVEFFYPAVLKIPDGSFSRGMFKVTNFSEAKHACTTLFKDSDLILAQEFVYTKFDWRIGILNKKPIFACQYFMSKEHWQIVKHTDSGDTVLGDAETWRIEDVPKPVVEAALQAANLIGNGLYGVDVKYLDNKPYVIEVNDNPNIDAGIEDEVLKDELYVIILNEFVRRIEAKRAK